MKRILFISSIPAVHMDRWYRYFDTLNDFETKLIICKDYMGKSLISKIFYLFTTRRKIAKAIIEFNPDIINLHTLLFPNYLFYKTIKCVIIITPWNGDIVWYKYGKDLLFIRSFKRLSKFIKEKQIKRALNSSKLITYNSLIMKKRIHELIGDKVPHEYIQVPGIDTKRWIKGKDKTSIRKKINLPDDKFLVLSARQLGPIYNIDIIIKTAHILSKYDDNITYIFVFHEDKKWMKLFHRMISLFSLDEKVIVLGHIEHKKMLYYYQASDIGISISSKDSCPQSVIEGMSTGLPMIVGNIPALQDLVKDNENGILVPCRNEKIIAEKIMILKSDKDLRNKLSKNARETVLEKHDYYKNMNKMHEIFLRY